MKIDKLEEIADALERNVLCELYSASIKIENCQIDKMVYQGARIRIGGYITTPIDVAQGAFIKDSYAYYWLELTDISEFILASRYIFSRFTLVKEKDFYILESFDGLKIVGANIKLDSITATWCKNLNETLFHKRCL